MTFEKIWNDLESGKITPDQALLDISKEDKMKVINYYIHYDSINKEPLSDIQLQDLNAIVNILQTLYSTIGSPISDSEYDDLEERLVDLGIPRLTGSIEINDNSKVSHNFKTLRGTLGKTYYLTTDEKRINKSRKYLDEWIKSVEALYEKKSGKKINLNDVKIMVQPKFDGCSCIMEYIKDKPLWITRGDTKNNLASDVSHIMNIFNNEYGTEKNIGIKFECMISEEGKDKINELMRKKYHNSRQIVTSVLNSNEPDFKSDYLIPVPLRIIHNNESIESIHPKLIENFPTEICTFGDRDIIRKFANRNRYIEYKGEHLRTDGAVLTILDQNIQKVLGRENDINNFEVAYKFTEESAYTRVKDVEFYISNFSFVTPILVINSVNLKGNTIDRISLSNKERFDELDLHYGDMVKILYDIIPYATIDENCKRVPNGRKIEFIKECPKCHSPLEFNGPMVKCVNPSCPSRLIGRILNYCSNLRIQNIGYQTLDLLHTVGLLDDGIKSLYKLKKHTKEIECLDSFGKAKTRKIINEIESKRKLKDYEFFGSLGIHMWNIKSFKILFDNIKLSDFMNMIKLKNYDLLNAKMISIPSIGDIKASKLIEYLNNPDNRKEIYSILKEVSISETYGSEKESKGDIVFTGCRPSNDMIELINSKGYNPSDSWSNRAKYLIIPNNGFESSKVSKAISKNIPILTLSEINNII